MISSFHINRPVTRFVNWDYNKLVSLWESKMLPSEITKGSFGTCVDDTNMSSFKINKYCFFVH